GQHGRRPGDYRRVRDDDSAAGGRSRPGDAHARATDNSTRCRMLTIDPVTLEVVGAALPAITNEMSHVLQRTSYNMMIFEIRDFCCAIVDRDGNLVSQNVGGVSHFIADLGAVIKDGLVKTETFRPGDVIVTNHQAVAGQ